MKKIMLLVMSITVVALLYVTFDSGGQTSGLAAGATAIGGQEASIEQTGPAWYDPAWHYRRAVTISNSGGQLDNYQVLIKLDNSNFNFDRAKANGGDVRFTTSNGQTLIDYWIESWNSGLAYIWVKVPTIISGNSNIYLYYNYPLEITTTSSGMATFDFFDDDWSQFASGGGCPQGIPWDCINPGVTAPLGNLELTNNKGVTTHFKYSQKSVGYKANFGPGNGLETGGFINGAGGPRTIISNLQEDIDDLYLQDYAKVDFDNNLLARVGNVDWHNQFHVYEILWWVDDLNSDNNQSSGIIDHGASSAVSITPSEVPTGTLSVSFNNDQSTGTIWVDWVYVRKYQVPEPTVTMGGEQGLVDLKISMDVSSNEVYAGEEITYVITITNTDDIDAPGVVVTDILPGGVNLVNASPSQGTCNSEVMCNLGLIATSGTANITLVVETTSEGSITNTVAVDSQGYDENYDDNTDQVTTTVLPSADLGIDLRGYPEAVLPGSFLTYIITVTNEGPSTANTVQVVETLPGGVSYMSSSPNICTANSNSVTCPLGNSPAPGTDTHVNIIASVQGSLSGPLMANATVSTSTHDPNPANNNSAVENTLDATKPSVGWVNPVNEVDETYVTQGETITLEAWASDMVNGKDQVARVEFNYWDHVSNNYVAIGTATTSPYQVDFNTNVFVPGETYQVFVKAYDRAGNPSDRLRIFIERLPNYFYMPLIRR